MAWHHDDLLKSSLKSNVIFLSGLMIVGVNMCESCGRSNIRICISAWGANDP